MFKNRDTYFYLKVLAVAIAISLPFLWSFGYRQLIKPNPKVTIAGGLEGGRYDEFVKSLVLELNESSQLNRALSIQTGGSFENIDLLEKRQVEFALFQSGSDRLEDLADEHRDVVFISNLFPEVAHMLVRSDLDASTIQKLDFKNVAVGVKTSGDYRVGMALVSHFNLDRDNVNIQPMKYMELPDAFANKEIELAILNVGLGAEVVQQLIDGDHCKLVSLPMRDAFLAEHVAYSKYSIPAGSYYSGSKLAPNKDLETVAVNAQLLAHKDVPSNVVGEMLKTLNKSSFLKKNRLRELFVRSNQYAVMQPEFQMHVGAERYFDPSFRPLINPDFVEATEGIRSFVVSGLIGIFFLFRWMRIRAERSQDHKLDQYIHRLLAIEKEQIDLDQDYSKDDLARMEEYLDEITHLRQQALTEFTAHDLDDPAIECFISMSHGLSEKIQSKLTRDAIRKI